MEATKQTQKYKVLKYLERMPWAKPINIKNGIGMEKGNIYSLLDKMVKTGLLHRNEKSKTYSLTSTSRLRVTPTPVIFTPNPLIATLEEEIQFIEDGINSLMITKSYIKRRIEQLRLEDTKRARTN